MADERRLDASKGGKERARRLSAEERREIARRAAEKRWGTETPEAVADGVLEIGDMAFPCAVLSDGTRVLTETDLMRGMGMYRSGALSTRRAGAERGARTPLYLAFKNLKPFVDKHLGDVHAAPLRYRTSSGNVAHGIRAEIIPRICEVWLDARAEGVLGPRQTQIAAKAEILLRGLAHVGIVALVDEATGYQDARARDALAKILERFIAKEIRRWVRTFPPDFYREMFRLWEWPYDPSSVARPGYVGRLTNDIIYKRLAPGVLEELKRLTPRGKDGKHTRKLHQRLSDEVGHPALRELLGSVVTIMKLSDTKEQFMDTLDRLHPKYGDTMRLPLE